MVRTGRLVVWAIVMLTGVVKAYDRRTPVVEAYEKNKDAVVSISSQQIRTVRNDIFSFGFDDYFFAPRKVRIPSLGSGFIINERGYIITNSHVVEGAADIDIVMSDGSTYKAELVAANPTADLAVLKVEADKPMPKVTLGSNDLLIGETVLAIGNPFGYQQTLTEGIISAIHRDVQISEQIGLEEMIQISAPINPGNSGGPLLNINGELIGINTAIRQAAQGIGFAIPIDNLRKHLPQMLSLEKRYRVDFGLEVIDANEPGANSGVIVRSVRAESPAAQARLVVGDIIRTVESQPVASAIDFYLMMLDWQRGGDVNFEVTSGGKTKEVAMELSPRPLPDAGELCKRYFGLTISAVTRDMLRKYDLAGREGSIVISEIEAGSPADNSEIQPGDIVIGVGNTAVEDAEMLGLLLENKPDDELVRLNLLRKRKSWHGSEIVQFAVTLRVRSMTTPMPEKKRSFDL